MSYPYRKPYFDNSRDNETIIIKTDSVKPKLDFNLDELSYTPIVTNTGKNKDPSLINIDWSPVIGYNSIKNLINAVLRNKNRKKTHLMIAGAPGTSKTVFLQTILNSLKQELYNVHYLDSTTLTSSGVIEYLFKFKVEYLLLDEIDKLEKQHQNTFLNLCESGILQETKSKKIRSQDMTNTIIITTANYLEKIIKPLKTRFLILEIPEYTQDQFYDIGQKLLISQYGKTAKIAFYIVDQIWKIYQVKRNEKPNLRQAVQVATLTDNDRETIDPILRGITDYSLKVDVEK